MTETGAQRVRRLVFGVDRPCPTCHLELTIQAPPLTRQEKRARGDENARRKRRGLAPLDPPPRRVPCPTCQGEGVIRYEPVGRANPDPGGLDALLEE